jgi:transposase InsO family protein
VGTALFIAYAVLAFNAKVIEALADVMVMKGVPEHLRSDNGPEFVARDLRKWLEKTERRSCTSSPDLRERTGYCESFSSRLAVIAAFPRRAALY